MTDEGPVLGSGYIHLTSTILLGLGLFVGVKTFKVDHRVGAAIIVAGAIPAAITIVQFIRLRRALGSADLQLPQELLPLGWSGAATYSRPLRGATLQSIEARLQCVEHMETGSGRSRREWNEIVYDEALAPQSAPMMERIQVQIPLKIPLTGPPSLSYTDTKI